jgi:hypothetical protein
MTPRIRNRLAILVSTFICILLSYQTLSNSPLQRLEKSSSEMASVKTMDLVRMSATELQTLLQKGDLTSVDIIRESLAQIGRHNTNGLKLRAIISVAPEETLLQQAAKLDSERKAGSVRGPLHGLPILVKVRYEPVLRGTYHNVD